MIRIEHLSKSFGKLEVLKNLNLQIAPGKISAVLGPNGSGKTTLIKAALGMVIPDSGDIYVENERINGKWDYRSRINYMPQIGAFPENLTVTDLIELLKNVRGQEGDESYFIDLFELKSYLNKRVKHLSGGTRQKVNIMLACMFNGDIIIMDEPTAGLDPVALINLKDFIRKKKADGKTILFTTHIMSLVEELADEIVFLLEGKIYYQGNLADLKAACGADNLEKAIASILKNKTFSKPKTNGSHVKGMAVQYV